MENGKSITHFEHEIELAFSMLEMCGVPRERARSVHNGIGVLAQRYNKQDAAYQSLLDRVAELTTALKEVQDAQYSQAYADQMRTALLRIVGGIDEAGNIAEMTSIDIRAIAARALIA